MVQICDIVILQQVVIVEQVVTATQNNCSEHKYSNNIFNNACSWAMLGNAQEEGLAIKNLCFGLQRQQCIYQLKNVLWYTYRIIMLIKNITIFLIRTIIFLD